MKKIVLDESFYEIVFFSHVIAFCSRGVLGKCLVWFEVFFLFIWWFFFNALMKYNHSFFPLFFCKIFVSCFFKKKTKVFFLLICKKKVLWMNWIVCWLSCRRICFFFWFQFFLMEFKKFIIWKKFFMCLFSFIVNMDGKKK